LVWAASWHGSLHRYSFVAAAAQPIADRDRLRIAPQRDHAGLAEYPPLVENRTADFAQYNAVLLRYEALVAPSTLHRLEIDPAHAAPLRGMPQDIADLVSRNVSSSKN
jgi:hypothetical protein